MENRFGGALWAKEINKLDTSIVGLGATGSFVSFFLARAGIRKISLTDFDTLEIHNFGSQLFPTTELNNYKVDAAKLLLTQFTDIEYIRTYKSRIQDNSSVLNSDIIISSLDSMEGRKFIFETFLENNRKNSILFDSRIGAEYWEVYAVPINDEEKIKKYKETLFDDSHGNMGACNYQQSSHSACGAALKIVELTTNWITNIITDDDYLPFKITNDLRTNNYGIHY